ncbi:MAG: hypothetical protein ACK5C0_13650 [Candidatus Kapaibacterium sp.]|jgi:hypothetical protein
MKDIFFTILLFILILIQRSDALSYDRGIGQQQSTTTFISPDSLFVNYIPPAIPNSIIDSLGDYNDFVLSELHIMVLILIRQDSSVNRVIVNPLYNVMNNIPPEHSVWDELENNIIEASKKWRIRFKKDISGLFTRHYLLHFTIRPNNLIDFSRGAERIYQLKITAD